ncbi:MAG: hypothetical protein GF372_08585 [Candidatus Marinimicrobia bacterium]|nr:hypothetical protein [Candidatus Neomarinimicrobiota bacterium]
MTVSQRLLLRNVKRGLIYFTPLILFQMIWTFVRRRMNKGMLDNLSHRLQFPGSLKYEKSEYYSDAGIFKGEVDGYTIHIEPDNDASIHLELNHSLPFNISDRKPQSRPEEGMKQIKAIRNDFQVIFKTTRVEQLAADEFSKDKELQDALTGFYLKWLHQIRSFFIDKNRVYLSLNYGQPFFPYILPSTITGVVPELTQLASRLEKFSLSTASFDQESSQE